MNGQKPPFRKRQELQGETTYPRTGFLPPSGKISSIVAHEHWHPWWFGRLKVTDTHINRSPFSCPVGNEIHRNEAMNLGAKIFIEGVFREIPTIDAGFDDENLLGQEWRYL